MKKLFLAMVIISALASCKIIKKVYNRQFLPLSTGYYNYKQLHRRGYDCKPFKGVQYILCDSAKANITKIN